MDSRCEIVGVVLAGGESRRMGRDKASLRVPRSGPTLLEQSVERLGAVCREVVVADGGRRLLSGAVSIGDGPGKGPAAGILGAAAARPGRDLLVLACDLPRVPSALLEAIASVPGADWVVPEQRGRLEPLAALYRPKALDALAGQVDRGTFALHRLAEAPDLVVCRLAREDLAPFGDPDEMFLNVNTPEDLTILHAADPAG